MAYRGRHCRLTPSWFFRLDNCMRRNPGLTRRQASKIVAQVDAERHRQEYGVVCQQLQEAERLLACVQNSNQAAGQVKQIIEVRNKIWYIREACMGDADAMEDAKAHVLRLKGKTTSRKWVGR